MLLPHGSLEIGIVHASSQDVEQIGILASDAPCGANAEVAELGRLVGRIPALHHPVEATRQV